MNQKAVLQTIFDSDNLPVLPPVASKLITLASNEETPVRDIIDLISKDIALSAKVLKLANSSFYSMSNTVSTIKQAVSLWDQWRTQPGPVFFLFGHQPQQGARRL